MTNQIDTASDYPFSTDAIEHLDWDLLIELHKKFAGLIEILKHSDIQPTSEMTKLYEALEARLISCEINPVGYGYNPIFDEKI